MGTPEFAIPSLQYLMEAGYAIAAVVTAPDRMGGRGMKQVITSPVKTFALQHGLRILQPQNLKAQDFFDELMSLKVDLQVVVAFRMLPEKIWNMPPLGTINLHGSLLPAYRGAAPIQWAIIRGEKVTGVTTFRLQHAIDTGEIILQREIPILPDDTASTLHDRMMLIGANVILATVDLIQTGKATFKPQLNQQASHAPKISHELARIDWQASASTIHNLIRGMNPFPGAWTSLDGLELKILSSGIVDISFEGKPGKLIKDGNELIALAGEGAIKLKEIQLAGKKKMQVKEFLNGYTIRDWSLT